MPESWDWYEAHPRQILGKSPAAQLHYLRNDCASNDWPVGFACNGLHQLGFKDLGKAGYVGSTHVASGTMIQAKGQWIPGEHSVAITDPKNLEHIGRFLTEEDRDPSRLLSSQLCGRWAKFLYSVHKRAGLYICILVALIGIVLVAGIWFLTSLAVLSEYKAPAAVVLALLALVIVNYILDSI